jgi:protein Tex
VLRALNPKEFTDETFGVPTVTDILAELEKPGRDPRPEFKTATFQEGVQAIKDLQPGMQLEGVVSNVTAFGAFVDIGVHQDGLVHISQLSDKFVEDPREVVKAGQVVKVKVVSVDVPRQRIALTMKLHERIEGGAPRAAGGGGSGAGGGGGGPRPGMRPGARPGSHAGGGDRRPAAPAPRDFGPKQDAPAANPFAAQLAKIKLKEQ